MTKANDMNIARRVCRQLADLKIANPNSDAPAATVNASDPWAKRAMKIGSTSDPQVALKMAMASSLGAAFQAKLKVGKSTSSKSKEYIIEEGKEILKNRKARCDQCSAAVIYLLLQEPYFASPSIEMLGNNHHCWLLCGRAGSEDKTTINNIATWGSNAFQIDLWVGLQYHALEHSVDPNPMNNDYAKGWAQDSGIFVLQRFDEFDYADSGGPAGRTAYWT